MTHRPRRYPRRSRRRAALAPLLLVPAAALVAVHLARHHHTPPSAATSVRPSAPESTDCGPELDTFTIEEFVEPPS